ncbi:hypothetical protein, unlikely [Trypanosoma brucei brucei TREU927]|uniref:Uncharacterized protein n=1 Tax=Trypanosoma brucei brucei (strain 927/4 GUTat10.1) TaxID=185431 RepID=Q38F64_TRYB2|nr:hypothetical protein, unlikely [Trypanosoma brucei brucei TREU927]EAN76556.1 hypothetical protein, unlikely [Trypanosoma brucei brucei TREU927]
MVLDIGPRGVSHNRVTPYIPERKLPIRFIKKVSALKARVAVPTRSPTPFLFRRQKGRFLPIRFPTLIPASRFMCRRYVSLCCSAWRGVARLLHSPLLQRGQNRTCRSLIFKRPNVCVCVCVWRGGGEGHQKRGKKGPPGRVVVVIDVVKLPRIYF